MSHRPRRIFPDLLPAVPSPIEARWMARSDVPAVLAIERASFAHPASEEAFVRALERRNVIGTVAVRHDRIVGYAVHQLGPFGVDLLTCAVAPSARRSRVGTLLVTRLLRTLSPDRRRRIECACPEDLLGALLFLRSAGFLAVPRQDGRYTGPDGLLRLRYEVTPCPREDEG